MSTLAPVLNGAVAMASFVATLFFLRFWRQTQDTFFLFFAFAFGLDAVIRVILGLGQFSEETEPLIYLARAVSFTSIIIAVVRKNRPGRLS
jgi:hypothetical protein